MIELSNGDAWLTLRPELGGAIGSFNVGGREVLRPTPAAARDALETACFPLAPFCNRIPHGRFRFGAFEVTLSPNMGDHPHPLHGQGWRAPWQVADRSATAARLAYEHAPDDWPWPYRAEQAIDLSARSVRLTLTVTNRASTAMPAALGFHPYFPRHAGERLKAAVAGMWVADQEQLPDRYHPGAWRKDWTTGDAVEDTMLIDHCHTGWNGRAELSSDARTTVVTASPNCGWLHVYAPPGADFLCVEPVGNMPDPFGGADRGIVALAPGDSLSAWMEISA